MYRYVHNAGVSINIAVKKKDGLNKKLYYQIKPIVELLLTDRAVYLETKERDGKLSLEKFAKVCNNKLQSSPLKQAVEEMRQRL